MSGKGEMFVRVLSNYTFLCVLNQFIMGNVDVWMKTLGTVEIYTYIYMESLLQIGWRLELAMSQSTHQNVELMCPLCPPADDCSSSWMKRGFF